MTDDTTDTTERTADAVDTERAIERTTNTADATATERTTNTSERAAVDPDFACVVCGLDARRGFDPCDSRFRRGAHHICLICSRRGYTTTFGGVLIRTVYQTIMTRDELDASRAVARWARSFARFFNGDSR